MNRTDSEVDNDSSSSPQTDYTLEGENRQEIASRRGKFRTVQNEIRKASAMSKLLNRRVGLSERMNSSEGIKDPSIKQAIKNFGKQMFKEFLDSEVDILAGAGLQERIYLS